MMGCIEELQYTPSTARNIMPKKHFTYGQALNIGSQLGITWEEFDVDQFRRGLDVELEHGTRDRLTDVTHDDDLMTGKIALAHLREFPDYYDRLEIMEQEAKSFWKNKHKEKD
jgi:hypothetical protein